MRYLSEPIPVPVGEPVRLYLVDAGPSLSSAFHVVGAIFDVVQPDGNPENVLRGVSTHLVGPGGGAVFELTFPEPGVYPFVTHAMRDAAAGAMGRFRAG
jgi:nitrite reductase (NO-forming)